MQINIGTPERIARLILGIVLVVAPFIFGFPTVWTWISVIVGLVLVVTGALRFCPAWSIFGINTGGRK
ncbi:YgaP family membrane protein [Pseudogemmobacter sonorensis]|uniref:YgaP family membrane protein n=1 Tax=Pseudogemmobacter sonorensis TaxID=2989681 RepID=UPI00368C41B7